MLPWVNLPQLKYNRIKKFIKYSIYSIFTIENLLLISTIIYLFPHRLLQNIIIFLLLMILFFFTFYIVFYRQSRKSWLARSITIYCGSSIEDWDGKTIRTKGAGGSEISIIALAELCANFKYRVALYGQVSQANSSIYRGVHYLPHNIFSPYNHFDNLIIWRWIEMLDFPIYANRIILDLHDVPNPIEFTESRLKKVYKIVVKSEWQRSCIPNISDEKIAIIPNGIESSLFNQEVKRNPFQVIYASAYDRGLEHLLYIWPQIKKRIPQATLHIYYGWTFLDAYHRLTPGTGAEYSIWKRKMLRMICQDGVYEHGRISQVEFAKAILMSSVWAYPTHFDEISCTTAMMMQAGGVIPVVINKAALRETVQYGERIEGNIYDLGIQTIFTDKVINVLNRERTMSSMRHTMQRWAKKTYDWRNIYPQWKALLGE